MSTPSRQLTIGTAVNVYRSTLNDYYVNYRILFSWAGALGTFSWTRFSSRRLGYTFHGIAATHYGTLAPYQPYATTVATGDNRIFTAIDALPALQSAIARRLPDAPSTQIATTDPLSFAQRLGIKAADLATVAQRLQVEPTNLVAIAAGLGVEFTDADAVAIAVQASIGDSSELVRRQKLAEAITKYARPIRVIEGVSGVTPGSEPERREEEEPSAWEPYANWPEGTTDEQKQELLGEMEQIEGVSGVTPGSEPERREEEEPSAWEAYANWPEGTTDEQKQELLGEMEQYDLSEQRQAMGPILSWGKKHFPNSMLGEAAKISGWERVSNFQSGSLASLLLTQLPDLCAELTFESLGRVISAETEMWIASGELGALFGNSFRFEIWAIVLGDEVMRRLGFVRGGFRSDGTYEWLYKDKPFNFDTWSTE